LTQSFPAQLFTPPQGFPPDLNFRIVNGSDLRPLHTTCYSDKPLSQFRAHFEKMLGWQAKGRCCWLVASDEAGQIVGSGQLILYPHGNELANLIVVPVRRNEGIGTAMIAVLTAVARHLNLSSLEIGVSVNNGSALRLYQRQGFIIDRQLCLPCQDPTIILQKNL
jgi:RimJ/RimL family protein N-acetyltransferase